MKLKPLMLRRCATTVVYLFFSTIVMAGSGGKMNLKGEEMVLIPAGSFVMGSNKLPSEDESTGVGTIKPWYLDEHPEHKVNLKAYYIDRYEITNLEYQRFVVATGYTPPIMWGENGYLLALRKDALPNLDIGRLRRLAAQTYRLDMDTRTMDKHALVKAINKRLLYMDKEPITDVSWYDADTYCKWAGERLPSEAEWEKAARGANGSEFPWGAKWAPGNSNTGEESWDDGVAPVGSYPKDKSPYGVFDMAGNVSEWVADWYQPYPGTDYKSDAFGKKFKVLRGAAWGREGHYAMHQFQRGAYRFYLDPNSMMEDVGFRCVKSGS